VIQEMLVRAAVPLELATHEYPVRWGETKGTLHDIANRGTPIASPEWRRSSNRSRSA
jgi:hypothetical protein